MNTQQIDISTVVSGVSKRLLGELLTIADACSNDKVQREAIKSLIRQVCQKAMTEISCQLSVEVVKGEKEKNE